MRHFIKFKRLINTHTFLKFDSASPAIFDIISGPPIKKKNAPVSPATAPTSEQLSNKNHAKFKLPSYNKNIFKYLICY